MTIACSGLTAALQAGFGVDRDKTCRNYDGHRGYQLHLADSRRASCRDGMRATFHVWRGNGWRGALPITLGIAALTAAIPSAAIVLLTMTTPSVVYLLDAAGLPLGLLSGTAVCLHARRYWACRGCPPMLRWRSPRGRCPED